LHFLLVQPDDSGMTYTGFWLLMADWFCYSSYVIGYLLDLYNLDEGRVL
jgi:hypothetical protein